MHPGVKGNKVCSIGEPSPFTRGDNYEIAGSITKFKKIFSRTTGPISIKLGTRHHWMMRIQVCSNEGSHLFPRGDNYERAKIHLKIEKAFSPEKLG